MAAGGNDPAGGRGGEVGAEHEDAARRLLAQKAQSRLAGLHRIDIEAGGDPGLAALDRMVHQIAGDDRLLCLGADPHAHVARRVPRCFREVDVAGEGSVVCDQVDEPGADHRPHGIGECVGVQGISRPSR